MEPMEVWPGMDSALNDLALLCGNGTNRGPLQDVQERFPFHYNDLNVNANSGKIQDRYLLPIRAWNRSGALAESGLKQNFRLPDVENAENAYAVKGQRIVKRADPKGIAAIEYSNSTSVCRSVVRDSGLNVIRMNSNYMTGVTIAIAGASSGVPDRSDTSAKTLNYLNTPKHSLSTIPVRHHHVRPYDIPWRREAKARALSEAAEKEATMKLIHRIDVTPNSVVKETVSKLHSVRSRRRLLKSRSLENVRMAEDEVLQVQTLEVDSMSYRIQHLHVDD